jgi:hypothetical protein
VKPYRKKFRVVTRMGVDGEKSRWHRIGIAFEARDGKVTVKLDSLPTRTDDEGRVILHLFEDDDSSPEGVDDP